MSLTMKYKTYGLQFPIQLHHHKQIKEEIQEIHKEIQQHHEDILKYYEK